MSAVLLIVCAILSEGGEENGDKHTVRWSEAGRRRTKRAFVDAQSKAVCLPRITITLDRDSPRPKNHLSLHEPLKT